MKKIVGLILIGLLVLACKTTTNAQEESTDLFSGTEIVTEANAKPIRPDEISGMENVEMGYGISFKDRNRSRSALSHYWQGSGESKKFFDAYGTMMYNAGSKKIIDVSEHQGVIDWNQVKASDVDGAILRLSYGFGNGYDKQFLRNVSECNRLNIPYGVYIYSYAYDANFAYNEAVDVVNLLAQAKVNLSYPIYYDIEGFDSFLYEGIVREHPTSPAAYESIIATFVNYVSSHGYSGKVHVYSYRSYIQGAINSPKILPYVSWIAAYTYSIGYKNMYYDGTQGWQYTSDGSVPGISGRVDISCFSDFMYNASVSATIPSTISDVLSKQNINFNQGYLTGFTVGKDISEISNLLTELGKVKLYGINGNEITSGKLATGQVIEIIPKVKSDEIYKMGIVIRGDVNGDGDIRSNDYALIKNDILNIRKLSGASFKAADVSKDTLVRSNDYALIKNYILKLSNIQQ